MGRNARFAQIWKSRKGEKNDADDSLREICHLYDAVQVDPDDEKHPAEPWQVLISDNLSGHLEFRVVLLHVSLQYSLQEYLFRRGCCSMQLSSAYTGVLAINCRGN